MYKSIFLPIVASVIFIASAIANPIAKGPVGDDAPGGPLPPYELDDYLPSNETEAALDSLIEKRGEGDFRLFQRTWFFKSCGPNGLSCTESFTNHITIHTSCNGGGCGAEKWRQYSSEEDLCGKGINVCGKNYAMRFTGSEPSCMRAKGLHQDKLHGDTYAELVDSDQKKVGMCYIDNKRSYGKSCDAFAASSFGSLVRCFFD